MLCAEAVTAACALHVIIPFTHSICRVNKTKNYGIEPRNAEQSFAFEVLNGPNIKLVALTGKGGNQQDPAGTGRRIGKTYRLQADSSGTSIVALSNKDLGFR